MRPMACPHTRTIRRARAVSHRPETETALAFLHCRIFGRKTGFHFPENALAVMRRTRHSLKEEAADGPPLSNAGSKTWIQDLDHCLVASWAAAAWRASSVR